MDKFTDFLVRRKKYILIVFALFILTSSFLIKYVNINYDITGYLSINSDFIKAYNINENNFTSNEYINVMVKNIQSPNIDEAKDIIQAIDSGKIIDVSYKEYNSGISAALYTVTFEAGLSDSEILETIDRIRNESGLTVSASGNIINADNMVKETTRQMVIILLFLVPLLFIILLLTTKSYIEPLLCLVTIGIAIIITMGTNIIFGSISFVSKNILAALTLAITMDYSIFILHAYNDQKKSGLNTEIAVKNAMKKAFSTVMASAFTTVVGFLALLIMRFGLGYDFGIVFAKAIIISLITVIFVLPSLILILNKLIEKTQHKDFIPRLSAAGKFSVKYKTAIAVVMALIIPVAIYGQLNSDFIYGTYNINKNTSSMASFQRQEIENNFTKNNKLILIIEEENLNLKKQKDMILEIEKVEYVNQDVLGLSKLIYDNRDTLSESSINSLLLLPIKDINTLLETYYPSKAEELKTYESQFISGRYSRIIITLNTEIESGESFAALENIKDIVNKDEYYPGSGYLYGNTPGIYEIKESADIDYPLVTLLSVLSIYILLVITFKSLFLPLILLVCIQSGIFINMSIPFYTGSSLSFIGYMVIGSLQLGATIDYAILLTNKYLDERKANDKNTSAFLAVKNSSLSILTSSLILTFAGIIISLISTNSVVSQMGLLIGRGAFISALLVFTLLPALLILFDKIYIRRLIKKA